MSKSSTALALVRDCECVEDAECGCHEIRRDGWQFRARLPIGWKLRDYVAKERYVELEDAAGNIVRCPATSLIKGLCVDCRQVFYTESRIGTMRCPHCGGGVNWVWGHARLAFVSDGNARFSSIPPSRDPAAEDTEI